ncbi:MAG: hypothetical protein HY791_28375 [Deltaproteobacteria bacterium]|nr:hypothetical protein [Deltaproteobacteria bacterium]
MIAGIILVVLVSNVHRGVGSIIGITFWTGVAYVGTEILARGNEILLARWSLSKPVFYGMCAFLIATNAWMGIRSLKKRPEPSDEE